MKAKFLKTELFLLIILLTNCPSAHSLSVETHEAINYTIAEGTMDGFSLDSYLKNNLSLSEGIVAIFDSKTVFEWLELGGKYEDIPAWYLRYARSLNHFHDPLTNMGYNVYGVTNLNELIDNYIFDPFQLFFLSRIVNLLGNINSKSSIDWALLPKETQYFGHYSWNDVRDYYHKALTSSDQNTSNTNFAETFRGLGQLMHLVQDASSPAHTRNDQHWSTKPEKNYEAWVLENRSKDDISGYDPKFFTGARNSLASFIDTDQYNSPNPDPDITAGTDIGLSEYTNANFFSEDTIEDSSYPYPQIDLNTTDIRDFTNSKTGQTYSRQYYLKNCCGETNGGQGYLLSAVDYWDYYKHLYPEYSSGLKKKPVLDTKVYADYADLLLPRAIGYSAGFLEYFFRGQIEVAMSQNQPSSDPVTEIHLNVKNTTLDEETGTGEVVAVALSNGQVLGVSPAQTVPLTRFDQELVFDFSQSNIPADTPDLFVTVAYKGSLGLEMESVIAGGTTVTIHSLSCIDFTADVTSGQSPLNVTFIPNITGNPDTLIWDFGDGSPLFEVTAPFPSSQSHTFNTEGVFSVSLTAFTSAPGSNFTVAPSSLLYRSKGAQGSPDQPNSEVHASFLATPWPAWTPANLDTQALYCANKFYNSYYQYTINKYFAVEIQKTWILPGSPNSNILLVQLWLGSKVAYSSGPEEFLNSDPSRISSVSGSNTGTWITMFDVSDLGGQSVTTTIRDANSYPLIPDPLYNSNDKGWLTYLYSSPRIISYGSTEKCKEIKVNFITVSM